MKQRNLTSFSWLAALLLLWTGLASAQTGQFYLVARMGPEGSITAAGQSRQAVYLRWDVLEGALPADVERLRLTRSSAASAEVVTLLDVSATAVMNAEEVASLYRGAAQARRLQETLVNLREVAAADPELAPFPNAQLFAVISGRVNPASPAHDRTWSFLASKADFNIARARYRGLVDDPGPGTFTYELLGVNGSGADEITVVLGRVRLDTTATPLLLGPSELQQVRAFEATCDAPERGKDHYSVALTWTAPGAARVVDGVATQVYLSGLELYRTTSNLPPDTVLADVIRDIAAEAAVAVFDERGRPVIPGLERVSDSLLNDPGGLVTEPKWIETRSDLEAAGLKPGDRRGYYLVARDFTGNYGPTAAAIVQVPNLSRPPAPWQVRALADSTSASFAGVGENLALRWDAVNLENYLAAFGSSRRLCNLGEATETGLLEYVDLDQDCDTDTRRSVRLDVAGHVVYRFINFEDAERFRDSDGDGISDLQERPSGTQCDARAQPEGGADFRVQPGQAVLQPVTLPDSGRDIVLFQDRVPAGEKDQVWWYRIASVTADGAVSHLTPPQRAIFPDRALPLPPTVNVSDTGRPACQATVESLEGPWSLGLAFQDNSQPITVSCGDAPAVELFEKDLFGDCTKIVPPECSNGPVTVSYPAVEETNFRACSARVPDAVSFCSSGSVVLEPLAGAATAGGVVPGPVTVEVEAAQPGTCVSLFQDIDGELASLGSSCGTDEPGRFVTDVPSGYLCGYAVAHDENNNVSAATTVPCMLVQGPTKLPAAPQLVAFIVDDTEALLRWRAPVEPLAAVVGRLEHEAGDGSQRSRVINVPVAGVGSGAVESFQISVEALVGEADRWCVSLRSIGVHGTDAATRASDWTPKRCYTRRADADITPAYLPWPRVPAPAPQAALVPASGNVETPLATIDLAGFVAIELADISGLVAEGCEQSGVAPLLYPPLPTLICTEAARLRAQAALQPALGFLAYRQERDPGGSLGDWIQVAPLIEFAHWDRIEPRPSATKDDPLTASLNDPWIELVPGDGDDEWRFLFFDRYPSDFAGDGSGPAYRYQFVYFDQDHRPVAWRQSGWMGGAP